MNATTTTTTTYTIRRPGCASWADGIATLAEARAERKLADRIVTGHRIVAVEPDGSTRWADDDGLPPWLSSGQ